MGGCALMDETTGDPDVCPMPTILKTGQELVRFRPGVGYDLNKIGHLIAAAANDYDDAYVGSERGGSNTCP